MRRPTRLAWTRRSKAARPADIRSAVVAQVKSQAAQAEDLAAIPGQDRLADPRLNPAVRAEVDRLRNEQQRSGLRFEHTRVLRRHRVADSRAAEAEVTLEAIALARQTASPARSVLALYQGRRLYRRITLAASVCLAAGSAMGVEAAARALGAHAGTGYIAEIGATGLSTFAIGYYAHLRENGATFTRKVIEKDGTEVTVARSFERQVLWVLMVVPLLASVAANLAKAGPVGMLCSIGAAAFALLSCVVSTLSSDTMQTRAAEVSLEDEAELRKVAMADGNAFDTPNPAAAAEAEEEREELRSAAAAALEDARLAAEREAEQARLAEDARQAADDARGQAEHAVEQARRGEWAAAEATARAEAAEHARATATAVAQAARTDLEQHGARTDAQIVDLRAQVGRATELADAERAERLAQADELAVLRAELRAERQRADELRAVQEAAEAARTQTRTSDPHNPQRADGRSSVRTVRTRTSPARTGQGEGAGASRSVEGAERDALVAELAADILEAADEGRKWYPGIRGEGGLIERTGMSERWCQAAVRDAKDLALATRSDDDTDPQDGPHDDPKDGPQEGPQDDPHGDPHAGPQNPQGDAQTEPARESARVNGVHVGAGLGGDQ